MQFADVIVDISNENLDKAYQYIIPDNMLSLAVAGAPVMIPFGKGNRLIKGYIIRVSEEAEYDISLMKYIERVEEGEVTAEGQFIALAAFIKEYFGATMNEALRTVIPVKKKVREVVRRSIFLNVDKEEANRLLETALQKKNQAARVRLLTELLCTKSLDYDIVTRKLNIARSTIQSLEKNGTIRVESAHVYRNPIQKRERIREHRVLSPEQREIVEGVLSDYERGIRKTYLIHGVTGSGKTEVYLDIIETVVSMGKQVILLIPEIALTFQTVKRFYERFGDRISILNSRMSQGERYDQSLRAKRGDIDIMIGPRSALFTPFQKLGLIIIDEEHEASYKSEMPPKYHARETAVERARLTNSSLILGSATPSLEAYSRAMSGEYQKYTLKNRAREASLPTVHIVDLREEMKGGNKSIFSNQLKKCMEERLLKREQIILFLNRRGYAGFVSCRSCGSAMKCPHCDISLTFHNNGRLVCHYCGYEEKMPEQCPACNSRYIAAFGCGTQKVEEIVRKEFPSAKILRMDADTTKGKVGHEELLAKFADKEADILIGTQMIVKGHDFPAVTLVGILAADLSLHAGDFRASERTFQLLTQASGRAGRGELPGEVIIQTYQTEHYSILSAAAGDYEGFYEKEMIYRRLLSYPPAGHILAVLMMSKNQDKLLDASALILKKVQGWIHEHPAQVPTSIIGPAPARLAKANDIYRRIMYIKQTEYEILIRIKNFLEEYLIHESSALGCSIQFDFDPLNGY